MTEPLVDRKKDSRSFDTVAELYDRYRPGYPVPLIEQIIRSTLLPNDGHILEIGSGTGKATELFAQRGYSMMCIEPGENMVRVARQRLQAYPNIDIRVTAFEDYEHEGERFDLAISAQAFHWVDPKIRYQKTGRLLNPTAFLAIFWNHYLPLEDSMYEKLNRVYRRCAPELASDKPDHHKGRQFWIDELSHNDSFELVEVSRHPWTGIYTTQQYLGLLNTYSDHLRLSEKQRQELFLGVEEVIEQEGGRIQKPYEAVAYIARKRVSASD